MGEEITMYRNKQKLNKAHEEIVVESSTFVAMGIDPVVLSA